MSVDSLVIDASAARYAAASDEGFSGIAADTLFALALLWSECTAVLREMHFRGLISPTLRDTALARIVGGPIQKRSPRQLYVEATHIAVDLGWAKTYDAEYVALARMLAVPLLTRDARLRRGATRLLQVVTQDDIT